MMKKFRITVEDKTYDVTVEVLDEGDATDAETKLLPPAASAASAPVGAALVPQAAPLRPAAPAPAGPGSVISPLAGTVVEVHTKVGQAVKQGDKLVTLEAMKMNTAVVAPADGRVGAVNVEPGATVQEGQVLLTLS